MTFGEVNNLSAAVHQSPPLDTSTPYDAAGVAGKTILITGGASGFGAAFARHWAKHGAHIALGDIDDAAGEALVAELRATTPGGEHHHYQHCNVADWASQVSFFRAAAERSVTGGIDAIVPNAGIIERQTSVSGGGFECPAAAADSPPGADPLQPQLGVIDVNLVGVLYSVHLALFWLPKNSGRDRLILLVGSLAGIASLPGQALYCTSKHAVTGLFRALRGTLYQQGVRINLLCPYFVKTSILSKGGRMLLAGAGLTEIDDVVDAATRFMADDTIAGRALAISPRIIVEEGTGPDHSELVALVPPGAPIGQGKAVWECYAEDMDNCEAFVVRYTRLLNATTILRGWIGFFKDIVGIFFRR